MSIVFITGTDTGVGKTVATAALACQAALAGIDVAVCKPAQTGTVIGDDDLAEIGRLSGVTALTGLVRYPQPLAPVAAAAQAGLPMPTRDQLIGVIGDCAAPGRLTLVEGAGGLLVELGAGGLTLADLAAEFEAPVLLVVAPGLGTLNHTALTLEALGVRGISCAGLVIGAWPADPGQAEAANRDALDHLAPVRAAIPAGCGALSGDAFAQLAGAIFDPQWVRGLAG